MARRKMEKEEIKKRVAAGIENRRKKGLLPPKNAGKTVRLGPGYDKKQRKRVNQYIMLALSSLCQNERIEYCGAMTALNREMIAAGFGEISRLNMYKGIAGEAASVTGESFEFMDHLARGWLQDYHSLSGKLITYAK